MDFLRLGSPSRVHPDILPYTPTHTASDTSSVKALEQLYHTRPVVATTCLGTQHPVFVRRSFDYCIIDEASQITLPVSLGPLRYARVFVLVGDHYQLPPLVQSEQARCVPPHSLVLLLCGHSLQFLIYWAPLHFLPCLALKYRVLILFQGGRV